jgi:hypothetical protein
MKRATLLKIANNIGRGRNAAAARMIDRALETETGPAWQRDLGRLASFLRDPAMPAPFAIFGHGNGKLPFLTWSTLPLATCPGAGECADWCYSLKAWRYPAAFARQAQNTVLLRSRQAQVTAALDREIERATGPLDFRLYVDGDFSSMSDILFWQRTLAERTILRAYGYSKSIHLLNSAPDWPENYRLNLSSGHNADDSAVKELESRRFVRGRFIAVSLGRQVRSSEHGDRAHQKELRQAYGKPAFTCPGECGECTPGGHACGSERFKNLDIIIATH